MAVNLLGSAKSSDIGQMQSRFSRFSEAFCVLIGIATGDEWTNYILEDDFRTEQGSLDGVVVLFFMSFNALVFILSFNIIVAVLIEGFMSSMMEDHACKRILSETREGHRNSGSLDPLLATLSNFTPIKTASDSRSPKAPQLPAACISAKVCLSSWSHVSLETAAIYGFVEGCLA